MINLAVYDPDSDEEILEEHETFGSMAMVLGGLHGNIGGLLGHDLGELMRQLHSESDSGDESSGDESSSDSSSSDSSSSDNEGGVVILHFYKINCYLLMYQIHKKLIP